jgi:omega-amidase
LSPRSCPGCPGKQPSSENGNLVLSLERFIMKIALIQLDIAWEDKRENYARAEKFFKRAAREACDIIVFPEMFDTGFSMNISALADHGRGETSVVLSGLAKKYGLNIIAGFAEKLSGMKKAKNLAVVFDRNGSVIAKYAKMHPFSFAGEDRFFSKGNTRVIFPIEGISASVFICYDLRFPEIFRDLAKEIQMIFVLANWPVSRKDHWETLLKARAIENQCFVIGVNRTGRDGNGIRYPGSSHVFDPLGKDICSGSAREQFVVCDIDTRTVFKVRSRFPFLDDIRS